MSDQTCDLRRAPLNRPGECAAGANWDDPMVLEYSSAALDLTDVTWALTISDEQGGTAQVTGANLDDETAGSGVVVVDASAGQITPFVCAADIATLGVGAHYYQVAATFPDDHETFPGKIVVALAGVFKIKPSATA